MGTLYKPFLRPIMIANPIIPQAIKRDQSERLTSTGKGPLAPTAADGDDIIVPARTTEIRYIAFLITFTFDFCEGLSEI
jgi:hypothetical protein